MSIWKMSLVMIADRMKGFVVKKMLNLVDEINDLINAHDVIIHSGEIVRGGLTYKTERMLADCIDKQLGIISSEIFGDIKRGINNYRIVNVDVGVPLHVSTLAYLKTGYDEYKLREVYKEVCGDDFYICPIDSFMRACAVSYVFMADIYDIASDETIEKLENFIPNITI